MLTLKQIEKVSIMMSQTRQENEPFSSVMALDVSMEKARALHRVWRALNDGDCPKCHTFHRASEIRTDFGRPMPISEWDGSFVTQSIGCPTCGFTITREEIVEIEKMFAPAMDAAIFEDWRASRLSAAVQSERRNDGNG